MSNTSDNFTPTQLAVPTSPLGHRLMFVLLTLLAFALFAPTVLLPILRDHCELLAEESRLQKRVAELEGDVAHHEELAYAFAHDSVINERLAVLDLRYRRPDEVVIPVLAGNLAKPEPPRTPPPAPARSALNLPDDWPAWTLAAESWSARHGLIDLFLDSMLRPVFLLMSGGLTIAAFVLFAPRIRVREASNRADQSRDRKGAPNGVRTPLGPARAQS
ncbi:MAG TPA: hypothetical protein VJZ71_14000 [Phycisphaerae bacterium]|nr:hypothetical protein [Phycisphaerae bacterium]